ncbi:hypothetical protein [Rhodovulum sp. PH10]|uniref:hypothetical protein n=1 Tax=Rhodovulum sp. PH10 TaxID=1187851 RepID=UPI00058BFCC9|nr:hypothetical protein [Rhodovulum sp. PH10]
MSNIPDDLPRQTYSLASAEDTEIRAPGDWWPCEPKICVFHVPTRVMFELSPRPHKQPDDTLELTDFRTRLAHLCEGASVPDAVELQRLGKEALLMGLRYIGLVDIPDTSVAEHAGK